MTLRENNSVWLNGNEAHRSENTGEKRTVDIDVFAPGRSFGLWPNREAG